LPGDVDSYRLEAASGQVGVELQPPPRLDLVLEVAAAAGGGWTRIDGGGRGQPERASLAAGGLLRVVGKRAGDGDREATYRLVVSPGPGPAGGTPP
jgi:hypothetical protein